MCDWCPLAWTLARKVLPAFEKDAFTQLCVPPDASTLTLTTWMVFLLPNSRSFPILFPSPTQVINSVCSSHHLLCSSCLSFLSTCVCVWWCAPEHVGKPLASVLHVMSYLFCVWICVWACACHRIPVEVRMTSGSSLFPLCGS